MASKEPRGFVRTEITAELKALAQKVREETGRTCAVVVDPLKGVGGAVYVPPIKTGMSGVGQHGYMLLDEEWLETYREQLINERLGSTLAMGSGESGV